MREGGSQAQCCAAERHADGAARRPYRSGLSFGRFSGCFFLFGLGLSGLRFGQSNVDPFKDGPLTSVTLALTELNDAGITTMTLFLGWSNLGEEDFNSVFLVESGRGEAAVMQGTPFAQRNHFLSN